MRFVLKGSPKGCWQGTPFSDTNLLHSHLKSVGRKLRMPWLQLAHSASNSRHALAARGSTLKEAQAQLGHSKMSTTLEIYTISIQKRLKFLTNNCPQNWSDGTNFLKANAFGRLRL